MRVFIGLTEIGGYYGFLSQGFQELGVKATFVTLNDHPFQYGAAKRPSLAVKALKFLARRRTRATNASRPVQAFWRMADIAARLSFFAAMCAKHDVFIFGFNSTFFSYRELPVLKMLRKKIVYVFNGSDSRPVYLNGSVMALGRGQTIQQCIDQTYEKKVNLRAIERHADVIVANPLSAHLHEKEIVSFLLMGMPYPLQSSDRAVTSREPGPVRIVHAPSHPEAKGTPEIRMIIERLQQRGYSIDFIELTNRSNREVLYELARCDFVVDQLYSDIPMGGFPAEAAGLGKPAVIGGYAGPVLAEITPPGRMPPAVFRHPDEVEAAIEAMTINEVERHTLGQQARDFVAAWWGPKQVASNYLAAINGTLPDDWYFDPRSIRYLHGACLSEKRAKHLVSEVLQVGGVAALQVSDKPELMRDLIEFSGTDLSSEASRA